ncbi:PQQ-binding-like beta-propeller repeat protein [Kitasatospora indigofera]|uniref:outer membrane protein assembly factor BamB family protein n=1 Tax=Kitasatospora indigofera TaxID=67307 RepID=UPI00167C9E86|nr:PQQ-binding-like beta-propeller repeat protein [Kitasatospora indigofera]
MAGDHPNPGTGDTSGGPPEQRGVSFGRRPDTDPAGLADQLTQLGSAPVTAPAGPPAAAAPAQGGDYAYQPTAAAFPAQNAPQQPQVPQPAPGAPVGPFDPYAMTPPQPFQAQQTPPPVAGGYGYPPQAPAPAFPQQPGYGYPGPAAPAPRKRNPVLLYGGAVCALLVVAIAIGLVVLFDDKDPKGPGGGPSGTYNVAWAAPKAQGARSASLLGIWGSEKLIVRGDESGIKAYNSADGKEAWSLAPPAGTKEFCSMSYGHNSKGVAAVALNTGDGDCSTLGAVDVTTGQLLWSKKIDAERVYSPTLSITDKVIAVGAGSALGGFNVADGAPVWTYQPREKNCSTSGAKVAGTSVVLTDRCYGSSTTTKATLQVLDAETGKSGAQFVLEGTNERLGTVLSDKPLVLAMSGGTGGDYVVGFDAAGKPMAKIPTKEAGSDSLRFSDSSDAFTLNVVSGTTLYVQAGSSSKPSVEAYDLTAGKKLWEQNGGGEQGLRLVSGADKEGAVRAVVANGYSKPGKLVTLGKADGAVTELGPVAKPKSGTLIYSITEFVVTDSGSLVAFPRTSTGEPVIRFTKG